MRYGGSQGSPMRWRACANKGALQPAKSHGENSHLQVQCSVCVPKIDMGEEAEDVHDVHVYCLVFYFKSSFT